MFNAQRPPKQILPSHTARAETAAWVGPQLKCAAERVVQVREGFFLFLTCPSPWTFFLLPQHRTTNWPPPVHPDIASRALHRRPHRPHLDHSIRRHEREGERERVIGPCDEATVPKQPSHAPCHPAAHSEEARAHTHLHPSKKTEHTQKRGVALLSSCTPHLATCAAPWQPCRARWAGSTSTPPRSRVARSLLPTPLPTGGGCRETRRRRSSYSLPPPAGACV